MLLKGRKQMYFNEWKPKMLLLLTAAANSMRSPNPPKMSHSIVTGRGKLKENYNSNVVLYREDMSDIGMNETVISLQVEGD